MKALDKSKINKILVISLTNIGDVILTFPVIDILKRDFPSAKLSVVIGPKAESLLQGNPHLDRVYLFDKHQSPLKSLSWVLRLRKKRFDLVVDLRNTAIPFMISPRYRTPCRVEKAAGLHMREKHLRRFKSVYAFTEGAVEPRALFVPQEDERDVDRLIEREIGRVGRYVIVAPGAADCSKRWPEEGFAFVCDRLVRDNNIKVVFAGSEEDGAVAQRINALMKSDALNLCGRISLTQLAALLQRCFFAIVNDSAPMHLASYLNIPVLALFGPTDPSKYGPWSSRSCFLRKNESCPACRHPQTSSAHTCMAAITSGDVLSALRIDMGADRVHFSPPAECRYKNILIVRTDRIGDVVLTTPAINALRRAYPTARISVLVAPAARDLVDGNVCLDEVLVDDRRNEHKGLKGFLKLVWALRRKRFDLAVVLHTKKRTNLMCFLAGIPVRIGYKNEKFGFLLNRPLEDMRHKGEKHEAQYCLDVVKALGIEADDLRVYLPVKEDDIQWADRFRQEHCTAGAVRLIAIHAGASDPSKRWPESRFAQLMDALIDRYTAKVVMIGGFEISAVAQKIISLSKGGAVDLTGQTTVGQLAGLLARCDLLVSNDSGPVHVAAGVGTPVVSIFTRDQPGINPQRWRPLGEKTRVVSVPPPRRRDVAFKKAGAVDTKYMELIATDTVLEAVDSLFKLC